MITGFQKGLRHFQAAHNANLFLPVGILQFFPQFCGQFRHIDFFQKLFDRGGAHIGAEGIAIFIPGTEIFALCQKLFLLQRRITRIQNDVIHKVKHPFQTAGRQVQD